MRRISVFLAAVGLTGCAHLDLDLAVTRGQARWYRATGLLPVPASVSWTRNRECADSTQAVGCTHVDGRVWVWIGLDSQLELERVMLHELGHLLAPARGHVGPWLGVMSPHTDRSAGQITQADLDLICLGFLCPWERPEAD